MTDLHTAIAQGAALLRSEEARLEAELLICHLLECNRAYLMAHPELTVSPKCLATYQQLIAQRAQGMPIAYLTESREFWSLPLRVTPDTLIPRHETECLVEVILEELPKGSVQHVLDLGTGSGAIALALAKERPQWQITATDQSQEALEVAQYNAQALQLGPIAFYHSDWFKTLPKQRYHAIISNPPYIDPDSPYLHQGDLRFEPRQALISEEQGTAALKQIIQQSIHFLHPEGLLLLEHGFDQKNRVRAMLKESGYKDIVSWQDIQGQDRVSGGKMRAF